MNQETLKEIETLAGALLSPKEICIVTGLNYEQHKEYFFEPQHPIFIAYQKGLLQLKYDLNTANIKFAKQSSSHAMNKVIRQLDKLINAIQKDEH